MINNKTDAEQGGSLHIQSYYQMLLHILGGSAFNSSVTQQLMDCHTDASTLLNIHIICFPCTAPHHVQSSTLPQSATVHRLMELQEFIVIVDESVLRKWRIISKWMSTRFKANIGLKTSAVLHNFLFGRHFDTLIIHLQSILCPVKQIFNHLTSWLHSIKQRRLAKVNKL